MAGPLPIVAPYAAGLGLLFIVLSVRVIIFRRRHHIGFGSRGHPELERRARVHANFAEYAPFALVLLAMAELQGAPTKWIHLGCLSLMIGRISHAIGVSSERTDGFGRVVGMTGSQTAVLIACGLLLSSFV